MNNPSGNKLEKLVFGMFDQMVEGSDKYVTKQGSTWLIFTEDKRWVVEFTKDNTLWFNYNLFQSELELIGKNCTEEKDLIKNWFESRFLNTNGVRHAKYLLSKHQPNVEDTIQNGVRHTDHFEYTNNTLVEDAIQEGVKETTPSGYLGSIEMKGKIVHQIESPKQNNEVEDTIQNGVRHTYPMKFVCAEFVEDTIQNGVRHTFPIQIPPLAWVEDTIQNGVKHTLFSKTVQDVHVEDTIQNGVKHTFSMSLSCSSEVEDTIQNGVRHTEVDGMRIRRGVKDAIQEGVKETKKSHWIKSIEAEDIIDNVIENGVKEVKEISNFDLTSEIFKVNANRAIRDGVKEIREVTFLNQMFIEETIQNGVKDGV